MDSVRILLEFTLGILIFFHLVCDSSVFARNGGRENDKDDVSAMVTAEPKHP